MSRLNLSPNYCSCTVNRARNLPDKSKNGIDPFCVFGMGKEKFATATREKTSTPDWHEQCDMPIVDDASIKLTVFHNNKSSLSKGDFIGRAYISLRDLEDYDRVHTNWYKLTNKDGKMDKERGEIEVSLQFYSKNNTTGSVLDLATKKKHLSLRDIKHSLGGKLKAASQHRKHDKNGGDNQLGDQHSRLGSDDSSMHNVRDFLDGSASETASFNGSHMSLNSMSYNNNADQQKKKSRNLSSGLGSTVGSETPRSSHRSITSDYETSSILDSASMYGADEPSTPSPPIRSEILQSREVSVDEKLAAKDASTKKKSKAPTPSKTTPTVVITNPSTSSAYPVSKDQSRVFSLASENKKSKDAEILAALNPFHELSTIQESFDVDETHRKSTAKKIQDEEENDFNNYFNQMKQPIEEKKMKRSAPVIQQSKSINPFEEQKRPSLFQSDEIKTPSASISVKVDDIPSSSFALSTKRQSVEKLQSTDDDVDELLGNLERMSSMRSSARRRIQPKTDIVEQPFTETSDNKVVSNRNRNTALPDIVGGSAKTNTGQRPTPPGPKKPASNDLNVLGYENVKSAPITPKNREELQYLDREELLHVIAHQSDLIKKRDTRVKDLESYTDNLLVKIVEQCPAILQSSPIKFNHK